jgi:hypothetical protein
LLLLLIRRRVGILILGRKQTARGKGEHNHCDRSPLVENLIRSAFHLPPPSICGMPVTRIPALPARGKSAGSGPAESTESPTKWKRLFLFCRNPALCLKLLIERRGVYSALRLGAPSLLLSANLGARPKPQRSRLELIYNEKLRSCPRSA